MKRKHLAKGKLTVRTVVILLCALCFLLALAGIISTVVKYWIIQSDQESANGLYSTDESLNEESFAPESSEVSLDPSTGVIEDFNVAHTVNGDVKGYILVPDTQIKTVVVQGDDNEYYLDHNFYGKNVLGIPFIDYRATFTAESQSMNVTIYGHDAVDGSYFAYLKNYKNLNYYKQHPLIRFDTAYGRTTYKIIGAFLAEVEPGMDEYFGYHNYIDMTEIQYETFLNEIDRRSYFDTTVDVQYGDRFLTLSTCENLTSETPTPYRMVVVARKVRPGEAYKVNTAGATANTDMIMPAVWVQQNGRANPYA